MMLLMLLFIISLLKKNLFEFFSALVHSIVLEKIVYIIKYTQISVIIPIINEEKPSLMLYSRKKHVPCAMCHSNLHSFPKHYIN